MMIALVFASVNVFADDLTSGRSTSATEPYASTFGVVDGNAASALQPIESVLEYSPSKVAYGDFLYIAQFERSASGYPRPVLAYSDFADHFSATIEAEGVDGYYSWKFEINGAPRVVGNYTAIVLDRECGAEPEIPTVETLLPGEKKLRYSKCLEFPPLEDWEDPFWRALRAKTSQSSVLCRLEIRSYEKVFHFNVLVGARPEAEQTLLDAWRSTTPDDFWPKDDPASSKRIWRGRIDRAADGEVVRVGDARYSPWLFRRFGNRKPGPPHIPSDVAAWRRLANSFHACGIRDEIELTAKLLDYYGADESSRRENANAIVDWFNDLPEPQRLVLIDSFFDSLLLAYDAPFFEAALELAERLDPEKSAKQRKLIEELEKPLTNGASAN